MFPIYFVIFLISSAACTDEVCTEESSEGQEYKYKSFFNFAVKVRDFLQVPLDVIGQPMELLKKGIHGLLNIATSRAETVMERDDATRTEITTLKSDLITLNGYKNEDHFVTTTDGYILKLIRILPGKQAGKTIRRTVLLHHDLLGSSDDWLLLGPEFGFPYILSDNGYDVWLTNARGNRYSNSHVNKTAKSKEFWDFSWHEIGKFDLPAAIDHIIQWKRSQTIDFIGHGMGCTALLVLLSTTPKYNAMFNSATFLGPLIYMNETQGALQFLIQLQGEYGREAISLMGESEFIGERFPEALVKNYCEERTSICSNPWIMIADAGRARYCATMAALINRYVPAGTSTKTISHFCQMVKGGSFQMFDYGVEGNIQKYAVSVPPAYNLNSVNVPVTVFSSEDDIFATVSDANRLVSRLSCPVYHRIVKVKGFTHTSFVWSKSAARFVYSEILQILGDLHFNLRPTY